MVCTKGTNSCPAVPYSQYLFQMFERRKGISSGSDLRTLMVDKVNIFMVSREVFLLCGGTFFSGF